MIYFQHSVNSFHSVLYSYYLVDCKWGTWTNWDLCTRSCGGGMQGRTRAILVPERNGGKRCVGDPLEMRNCNMQPCQSKRIVFLTVLRQIITNRFMIKKFSINFDIIVIVCKDSPRYAAFCPQWTAHCSNSAFVQGCCKKTCHLC